MTRNRRWAGSLVRTIVSNAAVRVTEQNNAWNLVRISMRTLAPTSESTAPPHYDVLCSLIVVHRCTGVPMYNMNSVVVSGKQPEPCLEIYTCMRPPPVRKVEGRTTQLGYLTSAHALHAAAAIQDRRKKP